MDRHSLYFEHAKNVDHIEICRELNTSLHVHFCFDLPCKSKEEELGIKVKALLSGNDIDLQPATDYNTSAGVFFGLRWHLLTF